MQQLKLDLFDDDDLLPATWVGPHVGLRLADAFATLRRLPSPSQAMITCWPAYTRDTNAEQNEEMQQGELELFNERRNRVAMLPSASEVTHMEIALCWPMRFLAHDKNLSLGVQYAARFMDYGRIAKRYGGTHDLWQHRNWMGCARIAQGLNHEAERVF
jgi:hypothetical protein